MSNGIEVLVVSPGLPYPPNWGFGTRVYQLLRALAVDNAVTLLCYARPEQQQDAAGLREFCKDVRVVVRDPGSGVRRRLRQARSLLSGSPFHASALKTAQMQAALDDCLRSTAFDVVQIESSQMACLRYGTTAALVLDEHNVESELL